MVSANEDMGMPFAIVINLEDFTVRTSSHHYSERFKVSFLTQMWV